MDSGDAAVLYRLIKHLRPANADLHSLGDAQVFIDDRGRCHAQPFEAGFYSLVPLDRIGIIENSRPQQMAGERRLAPR